MGMIFLVILSGCKDKRTDILVFDFGSPATPNIIKRLEELHVTYKVTSDKQTIQQVEQINPKGIILSGSPSSVLEADSPKPPVEIYKMGIPILGLCYGLQVMIDQLGGQVVHCEKPEMGISRVSITGQCDILPDNMKDFNGWFLHEDCIDTLPKGFEIVGHSAKSKLAVVCSSQQKLYGVIFHPERFDKTPEATIILDRFVNNIVLQK
jgi:GMP synthase (glutamine-hydrolysing)